MKSDATIYSSRAREFLPRATAIAARRRHRRPPRPARARCQSLCSLADCGSRRMYAVPSSERRMSHKTKTDRTGLERPRTRKPGIVVGSRSVMCMVRWCCSVLLFLVGFALSSPSGRVPLGARVTAGSVLPAPAAEPEATSSQPTEHHTRHTAHKSNDDNRPTDAQWYEAGAHSATAWHRARSAAVRKSDPLLRLARLTAPCRASACSCWSPPPLAVQPAGPLLRRCVDLAHRATPTPPQ